MGPPSVSPNLCPSHTRFCCPAPQYGPGIPTLEGSRAGMPHSLLSPGPSPSFPDVSYHLLEETWMHTLHPGSSAYLVREGSAPGSISPCPAWSPAEPGSMGTGELWQWWHAMPRHAGRAAGQSSPSPGWLQPHAAPSCERSERGRGAGRGFAARRSRCC